MNLHHLHLFPGWVHLDGRATRACMSSRTRLGRPLHLACVRLQLRTRGLIPRTLRVAVVRARRRAPRAAVHWSPPLSPRDQRSARRCPRCTAQTCSTRPSHPPARLSRPLRRNRLRLARRTRRSSPPLCLRNRRRPGMLYQTHRPRARLRPGLGGRRTRVPGQRARLGHPSSPATTRFQPTRAS